MTQYPLPSSAPKLMPFQELPFNGDDHAVDKVMQLIETFDLKNCIETGTCFGSTTQLFAEVFEHVVTIESNRIYHALAKNRLWRLRNVVFVKGDSSQVLLREIQSLEKGINTFFFLDAHWEKSCPLIDELIQIGNSGIKPVIMIHDFKVPDREDLGFDSYNRQPFTFDWIKKHIDRIYGKDNYEIEYNSEAEGAKRGIIYITPKIENDEGK